MRGDERRPVLLERGDFSTLFSSTSSDPLPSSSLSQRSP